MRILFDQGTPVPLRRSESALSAKPHQAEDRNSGTADHQLAATSASSIRSRRGSQQARFRGFSRTAPATLVIFHRSSVISHLSFLGLLRSAGMTNDQS